MARVKRGVTSHAKHKEGSRPGQGFLRPPQEHHPHRQAGGRKVAAGNAYRDRKVRKRNFSCALDPAASNARRSGEAPRTVLYNGLTYGRLIDGLNKCGIEIDRKVLSDMAIHEPQAFAALVGKAKEGTRLPEGPPPRTLFETAVRALTSASQAFEN